MTVRDWRRLTAAETEPLYRAEEARWRAAFHWDTHDNWTLVERARASGTLPGLAVLGDAGHADIRGWAFHVVHRGVLQLGALTAAAPEAAEAILDAVQATAVQARVRGVMAFVPLDREWLPARLQARGFAVRPFLYLERTLADSPVETASAARVERLARPFDGSRVGDVAGLLAAAYPGADPARPFAPGGHRDEWLDYTTQLVTQTGCGALRPDCCVLVDGGSDRPRLDGAVLTTQLSTETGHLAQVAVHPVKHGQGIGRDMIGVAIGRLRTAGFLRASLLVAEDNTRAVAMYRRVGFEETGRFLSAWRAQPTRSTMAACSGGGLSTLR